MMEKQRSLCNTCVRYRLWAEEERLGTHYFISAESDTNALCELGYDLKQAMRYFKIVVQEMVFPCTLCDVIDDLQESELEEAFLPNCCNDPLLAPQLPSE